MGPGLFANAASAFLFGTPRELTVEEIEGEGGIIQQFIDGAKVAFESGFKGIELHAA
jgi:2,4-dienoyl-CoA reductase-like NADH-dependent reductase (Old Yellow Enzyme family)